LTYWRNSRPEIVEARRSLALDTVGRLRAVLSKVPLDHAYIGGMPEMPVPAAAFIVADANSAVVIFREKNATTGVSHKVVANATISRKVYLPNAIAARPVFDGRETRAAATTRSRAASTGPGLLCELITICPFALARTARLT